MGRSDEASWWTERGLGRILLFQEPSGGWGWAKTRAGVPKGGLVGKSFQLRTGNPGLGAGEMIPPEGQAWSAQDAFPVHGLRGARVEECSGPA